MTNRSHVKRHVRYDARAVAIGALVGASAPPSRSTVTPTVTPRGTRFVSMKPDKIAVVHGDRSTLEGLYTNDVNAWTPALSAASAEELLGEFERRDDAFSDIELEVMPLDVSGDYACAEWRVHMTHTGDLELRDHVVVPASGLRITLNGVTVAEFEGQRICGLRQYWDELAVYEQLGLVGDDGA